MGAQTGTYPEQLTITNELLIGDLILICRDNKIFRINPSLIGGGSSAILIENELTESQVTVPSSNLIFRLNDALSNLTYSDVDAEPLGAAASAVTTANSYTNTVAASAVTTANSYTNTVVTEAALKIWTDQGEYDASSGYWPIPNHTIGEVPIKKGMLWRIGTAGHASGLDSIDVVLSSGGTVRALVDDAGQYASHWAVTEDNIDYTPEDSNNRDNLLSGLSNLDSKYPSSGLLTDILSRLGRTIENEITDTTYTVDPSDVTALGEVLVILTNIDPIACTLDSPNALGKLDGYKVTIVQGGSGVVTVTANLTSFKGAATTSTTAEFYWEGETKTFIATAGATAWRVIGG